MGCPSLGLHANNGVSGPLPIIWIGNDGQQFIKLPVYFQGSADLHMNELPKHPSDLLPFTYGDQFSKGRYHCLSPFLPVN